MYPLLFKIGPVPIHTYGFMIALGFLGGVYISKVLAQKAKLDVEKIIDFAFWCLLIGFVGCRILFVITRWEYFVQDPIAIFKIWEGGLVFYGGPLAVIPFAYWFVRKHNLPFWRTGDVIFPGLVTGHLFGRLGCFAAGCCYGKPTGSEYGFRFYSDLIEPALRGIPLHPTQLYEAGALAILLGGLLYVFKRRVFDGQVMLTYFLGYPVIRSIVEIYRGDLIRGFVIDDVVSTSQFISIILFIAASVLMYKRIKAVAR